MTTTLRREVITLSIVPLDWERSVGDAGAALLGALERNTHTAWRLVCPTVAVERVEPYRTLVLSAAALQALREQQHLWREQPPTSDLQRQLTQDLQPANGGISPANTSTAIEPLQFTAELYAPLSPETRSLQ